MAATSTAFPQQSQEDMLRANISLAQGPHGFPAGQCDRFFYSRRIGRCDSPTHQAKTRRFRTSLRTISGIYAHCFPHPERFPPLLPRVNPSNYMFRADEIMMKPECFHSA